MEVGQPVSFIGDDHIYNIFLIIRPASCTNIWNVFWKENLCVLDSSSVHHYEFFTVHTAMVYVIQVCWQLASRIRMELRSILVLIASHQQTCMTYTIAVCTVKNSWWWTEDLSEKCRVFFQNKFWEISSSSWFYNKKFVTKHGHMNIKRYDVIVTAVRFAEPINSK